MQELTNHEIDEVSGGGAGAAAVVVVVVVLIVIGAVAGWMDESNKRQQK